MGCSPSCWRIANSTLQKLDTSSKIFVAGHGGMVGSAVVRALEKCGYRNILTRSRAQLDLNDQRAVFDYFACARPQALVICAAVVGGIVANRDYPGDFIGSNLMIQASLFEAARRYQTNKVLFMASGCIYPRDPQIPTSEDQLLTGPLEPTNQWYAVAKIAGVKMGEAYLKQFGMDIVSLMPCNLYGEQDNFDLETAHVLPALVRKFHDATIQRKKQVEVWGTGRALREFLHVDDLASASIFLLENSCPHPLVNVGSGEEVSISQLAELAAEGAGYTGEIVYDDSRPDGTPRKLLDSSKMRGLGWKPQIPLREGIAKLCAWYAQNTSQVRTVDPTAWRAAA